MRIPSLENHRLHFRLAFRSLAKARTFSVTTVVLVGLAVGASSAVLAFAKEVSFPELPYRDPSRLVFIQQGAIHPGCRLNCAWALPPNDFQVWAQQLRGRADVSGLEVIQPRVSTETRTELRAGAAVTTNFFALLGLHTVLGRTFAQSDGEPNADDLVVLGFDYWRDQFGGDLGILNRSIEMDGRPFRVIGVLSAGAVVGRPIFEADDRSPPFYVAAIPFAMRSDPHLRISSVVGRLDPGVAPRELATTVMMLLQHSVMPDPRPQDAADSVTRQASVTSLSVATSREFAPAFRLLFIAVPIVSLIALVNVAGLFLSRLTTKTRDLAICSALGAGRRHLVQQVMVEATFLCAAGSGLGFCVAYAATHFATFVPARMLPFWTEASISPVVFGIAAGVATVALLVFGLAPTIVIAQRRGTELIGNLSTRATDSRSVTVARHAGLAVQLGLTLALITTAGIVTSTYFSAFNRDTGTARTGVVRAFIAHQAPPGEAPHDRLTLVQRCLSLLEAVSGIQASGATGRAALGHIESVTLEGSGPPTISGDISAESITSSAFSASGVKLLSGRPFNARDDATAVPVAILDEPTAEHLFHGATAIGRRFKFSGSGLSAPWTTIVGVIGGTHNMFAAPEPYRPNFWVPMVQVPPAARLTFIAMTGHSASTIVAPMASVLHSCSPSDPMVGPVTIDSRRIELLAPLYLNALLIGGLAAFCALIALVGTYGAVTYSTLRRSHELAIRVALGASRPSVIWSVQKPLVRVVLAALVGGLAISVATSTLLRAMLYGANSLDWRLFGVTGATFVAMVLIAGFIPALRASKMDPVRALRHE